MQIAIHTNEQGHPVVMEFKDGRFKAVDSERWTEILSEADITHHQSIVPVVAETNPDWIL